MMRTRLIVENGLTAVPGGFALDIRLPWYRTLPVSVIDLPVVRIDGAAIDPADISLEVNGHRYDRHSIGHATDDWWYVLDRGTLHVAGHAPPPGPQHDITVEVAFAPPYIPEITLFCAATKSMSVPAAES